MGNIVGYLILLGLCTGAALMMDNVVGSMPLYLLIFVLFFSLAYTFRMQRKFRVALGGGGKVLPRGVPTQVKAEMHNESWLPAPHLRAVVRTGEQAVNLDFSLSPSQTRELTFTVCPPHVGPYEIGVPRVRFFDPMGLFSLTKKMDVQTVTAVPRILTLAPFRSPTGPANETAASAAFTRSLEPDSYNGVREYQVGDSLRHIHWKLTSHTGRYMSRRYETRRREGVTVCVDRFRPALSEENCRLTYDCVTETGISLAAAAVRRRLPADILSSGVSGPVRRSLRDGRDIRAAAEELGAAVFDGGQTLPELLESERERMAGEWVLVCAASLDGGLVRCLTAFAAAGRRPALIFATPAPDSLSPEEDRILRFLAVQGIPWEAVASAETLRLDFMKVSPLAARRAVCCGGTDEKNSRR